jgi:hypothetical protein
MQMPDIDRRRRFIFRGNAAAVGGRIVRPDDVILESHVASSLTVAGGASRNSGTKLTFERNGRRYVSIEAAETIAEGVYDDVGQHEALTFRRVTADTLTTTTRVSTEVKGFQAGLKPILTIKRLKAELLARSPYASGEPGIRVEQSVIEGIDIGGHQLAIKLTPAIFQEYDTCSKLMRAVDDPATRPALEPFLLLKSQLHGLDPAIMPPFGRLLRSRGTVYATVVESLKWSGDPYPGATITDHTVRVPGFGKILFGELLISDVERRLTLLRLELGSPEGGDVACAEVQTNGIWP